MKNNEEEPIELWDDSDDDNGECLLSWDAIWVAPPPDTVVNDTRYAEVTQANWANWASWSWRLWEPTEATQKHTALFVWKFYCFMIAWPLEAELLLCTQTFATWAAQLVEK